MSSMSSKARSEIEGLKARVEQQARAISDNNNIIHNKNLELQELRQKASEAEGKARSLLDSNYSFRDNITRLSLEKEQAQRERDSTERALDSANKKLASLEKELAAERSENIDLRENLQRTLGYIDHVNEGAPQIVHKIESECTIRRGPNLIPLGRSASDGSNEFGNGAIMSGRHRY